MRSFPPDGNGLQCTTRGKKSTRQDRYHGDLTRGFYEFSHKWMHNFYVCDKTPNGCVHHIHVSFENV